MGLFPTRQLFGITEPAAGDCSAPTPTRVNPGGGVQATVEVTAPEVGVGLSEWLKLEKGDRLSRLIRRLVKSVPPSLRKPFSPHSRIHPVTLADQTTHQPIARKIPAQVFQTSPSLLLHPKHFDAIATFRELNPDYNHLVFDQEASDSYMNENWGAHPIKAIYDRALFGQMQADIFRYCIVFERGGFYLDINKSVTSRLSSLYGQEDSAVISFEKNSAVVFPELAAASELLFPEKIVLQWAFGFSKEHPILEAAIQRIVEIAPYFEGRAFNRIHPTVVQFTGPGTFTWAVRNYLVTHGREGTSQHPPDFSETGITRLPESHYAFGGTKHYSKFKHHFVLADVP